MPVVPDAEEGALKAQASNDGCMTICPCGEFRHHERLRITEDRSPT
ncbi:MAG: hypothetical protein L0H63_01150 [Nitrococcus sp.]|nr:hypothetical protein [Nitrococcus sp.]